VAKVSARGKWRRLQRALCDFGAEDSFARANARLREHYGFALNASAVREVTLRHAARAAGQLAEHYAQSFRVLPRKGPSRVVAEIDGTMICTVEAGRARTQARPREWKEMRLSAARAQGSVETCHAAGFNPVEEAGRRWSHCARDAGWALESRIHVVADGAEWIRLQSREVFGDAADVLVDFFHVSEYLAAAAPICRPPSPRSWLHTRAKAAQARSLRAGPRSHGALLRTCGRGRGRSPGAQRVALPAQPPRMPGLSRGPRPRSAHRQGPHRVWP